MATLIIGGGLSGLALAEHLHQHGHDYTLLEARSRFGGRIKTETHGAGYFDMGPAWFWPGQPRMAALIDRLGLEKFEQFSQGALTYEDERGQVQHGRGFASMQGSWRLKGGFGALIAALTAAIPDTRKHLNAQVTHLQRNDKGVTATLSNGTKVTADRIVLCLPPRIAAEIIFAPALPDSVTRTMQSTPTWMAGQAKAVAVYDTPFWRDAGLSGDVTSRKGPMVELHDASPATAGPYAIFGFIGVAPQGRTDVDRLRQHVQAQLIRLFGPQAAHPRALIIKDWAFDPHTATKADLAPLYAHPTYSLAQSMTGLWDHTLHFGNTEVAPKFGGYLEGALEAAENAFASITAPKALRPHAN